MTAQSVSLESGIRNHEQIGNPKDVQRIRGTLKHRMFTMIQGWTLHGVKRRHLLIDSWQLQFGRGWRHATRGKMTALWAESWHRRWFESLISTTSRT
jgi:hypothetical protein